MENTEKRRRPRSQNIGRMLSHGLDPMDFLILMGRTEFDFQTGKSIENGEDFIDVAIELGNARYAYAESELVKGHSVTASQFFLQASSLYRLADYGLVEPTDEKLGIYKKLVDAFHRGKELSSNDKPFLVEIPFDHATMPGYLIIPDNAPTDVPVVIVIPGATAYKEENYIAALQCWKRGLAALIYDGPGQGEAMLFRDYVLTPDSHRRSVKAVIDFLHADQRVGNRLAVYGISFGGYLSTDAALHYSEELSGCVCRGGLLNVATTGMYPKEYGMYKKLMVKFKEPDFDKAFLIAEQMKTEEKLASLKCPLLVANSEYDRSVGPEKAKLIYDLAGSVDKELFLVPGNVHCADDQDQLIGSRCADWLVSKLL